MATHPDFADSPFPRRAELGPFTLEILTPKWVQEDFEAVVESEAVLVRLFDDTWPRGLTLEDNREDLARHEREFGDESAFAWVILSGAGAYLGCAYVVPDPATRGEGKVVTWIREGADRHALLKEFNALFREWLLPFLPAGYRTDWATNDW